MDYDSCEKAVHNLVPANPVIARKSQQSERMPEGRTFPKLNTVILLHILSYTDPEAVCRFSRSCKWAKQFVDANIKRLPRPRLVYGRIIVGTSSVTYDLTVRKSFKIQEETKSFDIEVIFSRASYLDLRHFSLICEAYEPAFFRRTIETALGAGAIPDLVQLSKPFSGSLTVPHSCFNSDASFLKYLRTLAAEPLEAIFEQNVSLDVNCKIQDVMVMAFRSSFYTELDCSGACRTTSDCFILLADLLKALLDKNSLGMEGTSCSLPKIIFRTTDANSQFFSTEQIALLRQQIVKKEIESFRNLEVYFVTINLNFVTRNKGLPIVVLIYRGSQEHFNNLMARVALRGIGIPIRRIRHYMDRPSILQIAMEELDDVLTRLPLTEESGEAQHDVLEVMQRYPELIALQISGAKLLWALGATSFQMDSNTMDPVIAVVLTALESHTRCEELVDACLQLFAPHDALQSLKRDCQRAVRILGTIVEVHLTDKVGKTAVAILSGISFRQSQSIQGTGAIEAVLHMIDYKRQINDLDETLDYACRFLINATDLSPENCKCFLGADGFRIFWECCQQFENKTSLPVNMIGTLGNVAEVKELRCHLMNDDYLFFLCTLSLCSAGNQEMSLIATGILAHLVSDGKEAWAGHDASRQLATGRILEAIVRWNIRTVNSVNYDSLKPFLDFILMYDTPACQLWAVWNLANLTLTEGNKYCPRLENEGGVTLLEQVQKDDRTSDNVTDLASVTLENVYAWKARNSH